MCGHYQGFTSGEQWKSIPRSWIQDQLTRVHKRKNAIRFSIILLTKTMMDSPVLMSDHSQGFHTAGSKNPIQKETTNACSDATTEKECHYVFCQVSHDIRAIGESIIITWAVSDPIIQNSIYCNSEASGILDHHHQSRVPTTLCGRYTTCNSISWCSSYLRNNLLMFSSSIWFHLLRKQEKENTWIWHNCCRGTDPGWSGYIARWNPLLEEPQDCCVRHALPALQQVKELPFICRRKVPWLHIALSLPQAVNWTTRSPKSATRISWMPFASDHTTQNSAALAWQAPDFVFVSLRHGRPFLSLDNCRWLSPDWISSATEKEGQNEN